MGYAELKTTITRRLAPIGFAQTVIVRTQIAENMTMSSVNVVSRSTWIRGDNKMPQPIVEIIHGDITELPVDVIVNAAKRSLLGGSGVDGAIHRAAGPELLSACRELPEVGPNIRCKTAQAVLTPGFDLPSKHVIHTVGPVWRGGHENEHEALAKTYGACIALAEEHRCRSIAFPSISTGVYGFPFPSACSIALGVIQGMEFESLEKIYLVCYTLNDYKQFCQIFGGTQKAVISNPENQFSSES